MNKTIFLFLFSVITTMNLFSQKTVEAHIRLYKVAVEKDTVIADANPVIIQFDEVSDMVEFGQAGDRKYFVKMELLESNISSSKNYYVVVQLFEQFDEKSPINSFNKSVGSRYFPESDMNFGLKKHKGNANIMKTKERPDGLVEDFYFEYDLRFKWVE